MLSATQNDQTASGTEEASHVFRDSRGKTLYSLIVTNLSADTRYLWLLDSVTLPAAANYTFTADAATDQVEFASRNPSWTNGTRVTVTTDDTLPGGLTPNQAYYLKWVGVSTSAYFFATYADYMADRPVNLTDAGTGNHTGTTSVTLKTPPVQIPSGSTGTIDHVRGRTFSEGIIAVLSSADDSIVTTGSLGRFEATYST